MNNAVNEQQLSKIDKLKAHFKLVIDTTESNFIIIGETLNDKNNGISIKINDEILKFNVVENKEHIINVTNKDIILFSIIKSRLRFGRKNIYKIKSMEWKYDIELLILLVAFCDVVFFPEWRLFSWGELEYDLLEIDLKKNKK